MKKLMTMLAAAAMAFGLYADDTGFISGTAFETIAVDGGNSYDTDFVAGYWGGTGTGITTVQPIGHGTLPSVDYPRPEKFAKVADGNTLAIKTTLGNPVTNNVLVTGAPQNIGDGLYFDGLVNMTVFDADDTIPAADLDGAKLGVYLQLKGEDESAGTNFVVVAKENATVTDGHYVCSLGAAKISAGWHRLTIKAIGHIDAAGTGDTGFVVFVDGNAVNCEDAKLDAAGLSLAAADWNENGNLFVSRVANNATIASVAFDGQGSVDELVFTTTAPSFAMDMNIATVAFDATKATGVQYSMDSGATWSDAVGNPFKVAAERGQALPASIKVRWTGINGYMDNAGVVVAVTAGQAATIPDSAYTQAAAAIISADGTTTNMYATLTGDDGAVAAVNAASETGTLKLLQGAAVNVLGFEKSVTLDLNGQTVEAGQSADDLSVKASKGAEVTIVDGNPNGKVEGTLKAAGNGSKIIVTAGWYKVDPKNHLADGKKAVLDSADNYYKVMDKVPVTAVAINKDALELAVDGTETLTYTVTPDGADVDTAVWSSDNTTVATVDAASGLVTAIAAGAATITITVNGTITDTCAVTVKAPEPTTWTARVAAAGEHVTLVSITTNDVPVVNPAVDGDYTINAGDDVVVTYGLDEGYKLATGSAARVQTLKDAEGERASVSPTATAIEYKITFATDRGTAPADMAYTVASSLPIALPPITGVEGANFLGWTNATYTTATNSIDELPSPLADIALGAAWELVISPEEQAKAADVEGLDELGETEKAAANVNFTKLYNALGGTKGATDAWVASVYGTGNKIPAAKLAATSDDLIAAAKEYDLKVMAEPVTITVDNAAEGEGFSFKLADGGGDDPVVAATKVQQLVKYTAALGTTAFAPSKNTEVTIGAEGGKSFKATFVTGPAAGFMKVDLSVEK